MSSTIDVFAHDSHTRVMACAHVAKHTCMHTQVAKEVAATHAASLNDLQVRHARQHAVLAAAEQAVIEAKAAAKCQFDVQARKHTALVEASEVSPS